MFKHSGAHLITQPSQCRCWRLCSTDWRVHSNMPSCCLMVAAASPILFKIKWQCINQIFYVHRIFNSHNSHVWPVANPHAASVHHHQRRFAVKVRAGIMNDFLIGPYLLPQLLSAQIYCVFLEKKLPEMMEKILLALRRNMWLQHDRAVVHFARQVWEHLITTYNNHWIGQGGPVAWPPRSPDLTPIHFFLCDHIKALIIMSPVDSKEDFIAHIVKAAATIRKKPGIFESHQSLQCRHWLRIEIGGRTFEHLLQISIKYNLSSEYFSGFAWFPILVRPTWWSVALQGRMSNIQLLDSKSLFWYPHHLTKFGHGVFLHPVHWHIIYKDMRSDCATILLCNNNNNNNNIKTISSIWRLN